MAFNGSGVFVRLYNWVNDRNNGIKIQATRMDNEMDGMATGLSTCMTKDGQSTPTANIPLGNFRLTGVGAAVNAGDAVNAGQIQGGLLTTYTDTGAADAYVITPSPVLAAYASLQSFRVKIANTNLTTTPTLNVNGLGAKAIKTPAGGNPVAGALQAGAIVDFTYDGTNMKLLGGINGGTGDVTGPASSVDSEIALFDSTSGKAIKRATGTGYIKVTSGVMGTPAATVPLTDLATQAANTVLANATGSTAAPTAVAVSASRIVGRGPSGNITGLTAGTGITIGASDVAVDVGTAANKIVQLNGLAQLPAVDGSLLTGVASVPIGTPVTFSSVTEVAFAADFTTYSVYDLMIRFTGGGTSTLDLVASSNTGSSYATSVFENFRSDGASNTTKAASGLMGSRSVTSRTMLNLVLYQPLTTSDVNVLANVQSDMAASNVGAGVTGGYMPVTAVCNYLKLTFPNTNSGYYILTPRAKR